MISQVLNLILPETKPFDSDSSDLNDRNLKVIQHIFKEAPKGFEGVRMPKKYMRITQTSKPTATREMQKLLNLGILKVDREEVRFTKCYFRDAENGIF